MRIVVILGRVLDPSGIVVNVKAGRVFVNREEYLLQPADRCALEAALRIKDELGAEVVTLPRASMPDDDVLRQALALGADRAIDLVGEDMKAADDAVMARVLAAAVERLGGVDLILTGATTLDTGWMQLGSRLAEALGCAQVTEVWAVKVADGRLEAVRQEGGAYVLIEAGLPAVVTLQPGALKLRYPDGARLVNIYKNEGEIAQALEAWDAVELVGEPLTPLVEGRGRDFPPQRELGVRASGGAAEMVQAAAEALRQRVGR